MLLVSNCSGGAVLSAGTAVTSGNFTSAPPGVTNLVIDTGEAWRSLGVGSYSVQPW
jgi:hypothetical protein